jgi:DNA-binding LytR/AlgR family response regulator
MKNLTTTNQDIYIKVNQIYPLGAIFQKVKKEDILFIKSDKDYVLIRGNDFMYRIHSTLHEVIKKINYKYLVQSHKSYAVNINQIDFILDKKIKISKYEIRIGRKYRQNLLKQLLIL